MQYKYKILAIRCNPSDANPCIRYMCDTGWQLYFWDVRKLKIASDVNVNKYKISLKNTSK